MRALLAGTVALLGATVAQAAIDVRIADVTVLEGVTSVNVPVYGVGPDQISDMVAAIRVDDGGTQTDNDPRPLVQGFSLSDSVWMAAAGGVSTTPDYLNTEVGILNVSLLQTGQSVAGEGLLFTVTVDLTGFSEAGSSWPLYLHASYPGGGSDTTELRYGALDVTGQLLSGSITVLPVPEPGIIMGLGVVSCVALVRRRSRRA